MFSIKLNYCFFRNVEISNFPAYFAIKYMFENLASKKYLPLGIFLFAAVLYMVNSWGVSIYILDEAKNASCAREMFESGNLLVPTFNSELRTDKPPLHYFFMMLSYSIFGVNPFAARFFSAIFGGLTILLSFIYTRKFTNAKTAMLTAIVLLASIHLSIQFHLAVPDPYLIFFITWSMFAFFAAVQTKNSWEVIYMYLAMALGTLAKGPVAILLPGLIFLLYLLFSRSFKWQVIKALKPFAGAIIVILLVLPWYILNGLETDWEWTRGFFLDHNVNRFSDPKEGHGGIFLITLLFVFAGLLPFSVYLPQAIINALREKQKHFVLFNLIAGITVVAFFSVSQTKLPNYTVPSYPFLAVLIALFIAEKAQNFRQLKFGYFILLLLSILLPIGAFVGMKYDPSLASVQSIAIWLLVLPFFLLLAYYYRKNTPRFLLFFAVSGIISATVFFTFVYPAIDRQNPVYLSRELVKNKELAYFEKFNPSFAFYYQKEIRSLQVDEFNEFFNEHPDGLIISTVKRIKDVDLGDDYEVVFTAKDVFEIPTTVLISKKR